LEGHFLGQSVRIRIGHTTVYADSEGLSAPESSVAVEKH
jgi:hypothetical protein